METLRLGLHRPSGEIPGGQTIKKYVRIRVANAQCYGYLGEELKNASFLLFGETVPLLDDTGSLFKILVFGKYEELIPPACVTDELIESTHYISVPYARVVESEDVKSSREIKKLGSEYLRFTSPVRVVKEADRGTGRHVLVEGAGWIPANAVREIGDHFPDFVEVVGMLMPSSVYGHGERGGLAGDCSSVIQSACLVCGIPCPRIAGDIAKEFGIPVSLSALDGDLRCGDIVCWSGHVGVMLDATTIRHSSEWTMGLAEEPLRDLIARRREHEPPGKREVTAIRRWPFYKPLP
ncbi:MAG TPA: hypothetical protein VEA92_00815 [Candidatus Paceibacterota bacterium]|nr:hypothetical protein [Candidatus Paceibacterota bacterium]